MATNIQRLLRHIEESALSVGDGPNPVVEIRLSCLVWLIRHTDLDSFEETDDKT